METRSSPSMKELHALAAERGLKYYRHLSKPELFDLLQRKEGGCPSTAPSTPVATPSQATTGACPKESSTSRSESPSETSASRQSPSALTISPIRLKVKRCSERISSLKRKAEPDHKLDVEESNNKRMKRVINTLDPIMLTELGPHTFEFKRTNGSIVAYNLETLVQYILATGDFSEPQTRIPFSDEDLRRMDLEATRAKLGLRSVLDAKHNKHEFDDKKVKRDGLLGLERCAGEFVTKMLQIIESEDSEEGEMVLLMDVFPSFSDIFEQIRRNDKEYAKQCMNHFKAFVRGPKNRPTVDNSGLLPVIMTFLDDVAKGRQAASAFGF